MLALGNSNNYHLNLLNIYNHYHNLNLPDIRLHIYYSNIPHDFDNIPHIHCNLICPNYLSHNNFQHNHQNHNIHKYSVYMLGLMISLYG